MGRNGLWWRGQVPLRSRICPRPRILIEAEAQARFASAPCRALPDANARANSPQSACTPCCLRGFCSDFWRDASPTPNLKRGPMTTPPPPSPDRELLQDRLVKIYGTFEPQHPPRCNRKKLMAGDGPFTGEVRPCTFLEAFGPAVESMLML